VRGWYWQELSYHVNCCIHDSPLVKQHQESRSSKSRIQRPGPENARNMLVVANQKVIVMWAREGNFSVAKLLAVTIEIAMLPLRQIGSQRSWIWWVNTLTLWSSDRRIMSLSLIIRHQASLSITLVSPRDCNSGGYVGPTSLQKPPLTYQTTQTLTKLFILLRSVEGAYLASDSR